MTSYHTLSKEPEEEYDTNQTHYFLLPCYIFIYVFSFITYIIYKSTTTTHISDVTVLKIYLVSCSGLSSVEVRKLGQPGLV